MRTRWLWALSALLMLPLWGCEENDGYSLGDYWITTATIEKGDVSPYVIVTDNGSRLFPSATAIPWFETRDQQRVWVNFTILGDATGEFDHYVKVNNMSEILTKGILELTTENADSIGDDAVRINNYWFTGDFLTIQFSYGGGETIHFINLVQDVDNPVDDQGRPVLLFRHNRNDDPANYELHGTVSINLYDLRVDGQSSVSFVLKSTPFAGEDPVDVVLEYHYGTVVVQQVNRTGFRDDTAIIE